MALDSQERFGKPRCISAAHVKACEQMGKKSDTEALRGLFLGLYRGECGGAGRRCADVRTQPRCGPPAAATTAYCRRIATPSPTRPHIMNCQKIAAAPDTRHCRASTGNASSGSFFPPASHQGSEEAPKRSLLYLSLSRTTTFRLCSCVP